MLNNNAGNSCSVSFMFNILWTELQKTDWPVLCCLVSMLKFYSTFSQWNWLLRLYSLGLIITVSSKTQKDVFSNCFILNHRQLFCTLSILPYSRGGSRIFKKGGGGGTTLFFFRTAVNLESRASPKKADERGGGGGGGGLRHIFFRSATKVDSRARGGGSETFLCSDTFMFLCFFFLRFQKGGHMYKKGGGQL